MVSCTLSRSLMNFTTSQVQTGSDTQIYQVDLEYWPLSVGMYRQGPQLLYVQNVMTKCSTSFDLSHGET